MSKPMRAAAAACLGVMLLAPFSGAQQEPVKADTARFGNPTATGRAYQDYIYGVIKSVKSDEMVLSKTQFGLDTPFKLDRKTKYVRDGKPSSFDQLKAGDGVWVNVKKDKKTGTMLAKKVVIGTELTE